VRFLEKNFRKLLRLEGTPVRIELRDDENPYTRDEQELNYREVARRRRILKNREHLRERQLAGYCSSRPGMSSPASRQSWGISNTGRRRLPVCRLNAAMWCPS